MIKSTIRKRRSHNIPDSVSAKLVKAKAPEPDHAKEQAIAQFESIHDMMQALTDAQKAYADDDNCATMQAVEEAERAIEEDPLCVEVRGGWYCPGNGQPDDEEYSILLCTGGPAVRVYGQLDEHNQPRTAVIEYQDWGTLWTELRGMESQDRDVLLAYAQRFYFGD